VPDGEQRYVHLLIADHVESRDFTRQGRGDRKIRDVERRAHGTQIQRDAAAAIATQDARRALPGLEELEALGVIITIEGSSGYPLKLDSLEQRTTHRDQPLPKWLLLSVAPETDDSPERALVWVSDDYREKFLQIFEDYLTKLVPNSENPRNRELVANTSRIRATVLLDLWQSAGDPPTSGRRWWEIWLRPTPDAVDLVERFATAAGLQVAPSRLRFDTRHVVWVNGRWPDLLALPFTSIPVTELRRPQFIDTIEDLDLQEQLELTKDLADRLIAAEGSSPAVCLIDTGVRRSHVLLHSSLAEADMHSVVGLPAGDLSGHGTRMAGLALFGPLDDLLLGSGPVRLRHRLESVKYLPDKNSPPHEPASYGVKTAEAVVVPEVAATHRRRVYCMTITRTADRPGEPSLWSSALDALAAGTDVGQSDEGIDLLGPPDPSASRLVIISAGNVDPTYQDDYRQHCELSPIEDPAQAWNALTVGACTSLTDSPSDPTFAGWTALAAAGDVSPHSRTGVIAGGSQWPIKPDICMEGGNVLTDRAGDFHDSHPLLSLRTTDRRDDAALASANATSAAAAQASRLAALAMATYPSYWPETIRGLLTHSAEWTPAMRAEITAQPAKKQRRLLLKRFGWGVPDEAGVLSSSLDAVTMVVQDEFVPFTGADYKMRHFRLHQLPWPTDVLENLGPADVALRVTLSYFIEPSAARRGWRRRYAYASHGLRFELRSPDETTGDFIRRVNRDAVVEEEGVTRPNTGADNWTLGSDQRSKGSLHQDVWSGYGAQLARTGGVLAVHAVGGWWKNNKRKDRIELPVRYALLVSLRTAAQDVDLYTPIAASIALPVESAVIEV
jgi:hypothetical protein